jgi:FKBP-type peptidyl-prolyl cis-trans isomerase 2
MVKNGDFIKINYTGKRSDGSVFDTTVESVAKTAGIPSRKPFKPAIICVGQGMLIKGLDAALIGKSGSFSVTIPAGQAFGKKNPDLVHIVPEKDLLAQQIHAVPGLELNIDGKYGIVRSVSAGRIVVDFNHPLADHDVTYDVEILGQITELKEQVKALLDPIGIPYKELQITDKKVLIKLPQLLPQPVMQTLNDRITTLTATKTVAFEQGG